MRRVGHSLAITVLVLLQSAPIQAKEATMKKVVTAQASFVVYLPEGWKAMEGVQPGYRSLIVSDPDGKYEAAMCYGWSLAGNNSVALAKAFAARIGGQYPDLEIRKAYRSKEGQGIVFDGNFSDPNKGKRAVRCWVTVKDGYFTYSRIEAPEGEFSKNKERLLTILANVRLLKGAMNFKGGTLTIEPLADHRLGDGSATVKLPKGWQLQDMGTGSFVATSPTGPYSFIVGSVELLDPRLGFQVPGALMSDYLPPSKGLKFVAEKMRLASNIRLVEVTPRKDLVQQISQQYTVGPVLVEESLFTATSRTGEQTKSYSFGVSFGSRLGTNWRLWHMTVGVPVNKFDSFVPTLAAMMKSYKINDEFASGYIARGMARVMEMQRQTSELIARNAQEIHTMMQAAYEERQRSMDYIDYQRTSYIRGTQDWISSMEGGVVYHTDSWGTRNTYSGDHYQGTPFDYVHFQGQGPRYDEQMTPINSRELWERHIRR